MDNNFDYKGLRFTYITDHDLTNIIDLFGKVTVCRFLRIGPNTAEETRAFFTPFIQATQDSLKEQELPQHHIFVVEKDGVFLGQGILQHIPYSFGNYGLTCIIDTTHWGQGYGKIVGEFLVKYGFETLSARRISTECYEINQASYRIINSLGMKQEGCVRQFYFFHGQWYNNLLFGLFKEEYI
ncbi:MAG: GNAT family N-acetyltransferase [Brevinema sp.]